MGAVFRRVFLAIQPQVTRVSHMFIALTDRLVCTVIQVVEQRDVAVAFLERLPIDSDPWQSGGLHSLFAATDGPLDDVPSLAPLRPKNAHRPFGRLRCHEDVNREPFEHNREPTTLSGPQAIGTLDALNRARHPRDTC